MTALLFKDEILIILLKLMIFCLLSLGYDECFIWKLLDEALLLLLKEKTAMNYIKLFSMSCIVFCVCV